MDAANRSIFNNIRKEYSSSANIEFRGFKVAFLCVVVARRGDVSRKEVYDLLMVVIVYRGKDSP